MSTEPREGIQRHRRGLEALPPISRSIENGTLHETRAFRGLTRDRAIGYLETLGGDRIDENHVEGDGWRADLETSIEPVGPSYRLTQVSVTWVGDRDVLEDIIFRFRLKAFRAPG